MGLKANFTAAQFRARLQQDVVVIEMAIVTALQKLGTDLVNFARSGANFTDRTGNLRSSFGWVVFANGAVQGMGFEGDKPEGVQTGQAFAESLASDYSTGYALVIVAGMDYAAAVEARGYDVLASAELLSMQQLPMLKAQLMAKIKRMK